jgi:hypothetical protein
MHLCGVAKMVSAPYRRKSGFRLNSGRTRRAMYIVQYNAEDNGDVLRTEVHFNLHQQMYKKKREKEGIERRLTDMAKPRFFLLIYENS